jgi:hypothetical protein
MTDCSLLAGRRTGDAEQMECLISEEEKEGEPELEMTVAQHVLEMKEGIPIAVKWLVRHSERSRRCDAIFPTFCTCKNQQLRRVNTLSCLQFFVDVGLWKAKAVEQEEDDGDGDSDGPDGNERGHTDAVNEVRPRRKRSFFFLSC